MSKFWYALRVKPHKENAVYQRLEHAEIEAYSPMVAVQPKNPRSAKRKPYFPGYLFIKTDLEEVGSNTINWMPGTLGLVAFDGEPATVAENLITEIKRRLAEIEAAGGLTLDGLEHGDTVRITSGPFAGYEAIFDMRLPGKERVQILLAFLSSHPQPVEIDAGYIEKAPKKQQDRK